VNIKILLERAMAGGELTLAQRDGLLAEMTGDVAGHVLEDNQAQTRALYNATAQAAGMVDVHARFISALERTGHLNRAVEFLPSTEELEERCAAGKGLTMPEFAVLMAYAKNTVWDELFESDSRRTRRSPASSSSTSRRRSDTGSPSRCPATPSAGRSS